MVELDAPEIRAVAFEGGAVRRVNERQPVYRERGGALAWIDRTYGVMPAGGLVIRGAAFHRVGGAAEVVLPQGRLRLGPEGFDLGGAEAPIPADPVGEPVESAVLLGFHAPIYNNIGHFIADQLPIFARAGQIRALGFSRVVVMGVQSDLLRRRIVELFDQLVAEKFDIVFSMAPGVRIGRCLVPQGISRHPWGKSALLRRLVHRRFPPQAGPGGGARLYVGRKDAADRRVVNEPEVEAMLAARGFRSVLPATCPPQEAQALFGGAEVVLGPLGAGLSHVIYCQPGARLVCLSPEAVAGQWFYGLARMFDLEFLSYFTPSEAVATAPANRRFDADFAVDVGQLADCVDDLLAGRAGMRSGSVGA